ncbi:polyprenyl synthetase family protein [Pseudoroseicyclus tamaricis]|uniref:Geranylgeranyl diphosphate synthase n=1 Tax=Pseudoroseicyclus tamaricis TaxID=2705421 RepID=A0A6B2JN49_9RHOB|nr:farnesyl diphosphate synthase [Pseudoroseicyclus tamaricis]NDU99399.1 polyprenyl synthetase family protein [Pseudoroseicyclus tamaricis]
MPEATLAAHGARVQARLTALIPGAEGELGRLAEAMAYAVDGGKRVRGALAIETAALCGLSQETGEMVAAAVEAFHAYSLVHDDLPAMDDDDLRRGRPTVHKAYGEDMGILVGDALQALSFEALARIDDPAVVPGGLARAVAGLAGVGGVNGMVGGQWLDLAAERGPRPADPMAHITQIQRLKTGALIRYSASVAAMLSGRDAAPLTGYADAIGLAFQIRDDLLDVEGSPEEVGKATGKDAGRGKATFVELLGPEAARAKAEALVEEAVEALAPFGEEADVLRALARFIVTRRN